MGSKLPGRMVTERVETRVEGMWQAEPIAEAPAVSCEVG